MRASVALLTDEDVRGAILAGLRRHHPQIDLLDVREVGLDRTPDDQILEWAAARERVVVTQDESTMTPAAYDRLRRGLRMPGMILAPQHCPVGRAIRDIAGLVERSAADPLDGRVIHLPLDKAWRVLEEEPDWEMARP